jgi:hypothetical protein
MSGGAGPRWRWVVAAAGGLVAVTVGVVIVLFAVREDPGGKPVGEAVEEFRATTVPDRESPASGPEPGVYLADGEGREAISFPPVSQQDGTPIPVRVETLADDCWRVRVDFNEAHWQDWTYCLVDESVVDRGGKTFQRWDFGATKVENVSEFTCDPAAVVIDPDAQDGDRWEQSCVGTSSQVTGTTASAGSQEFLGEERLRIGGREVVTRRYRQDRAISGTQQGRTTVEGWFEVESHLPVRMEREVRIDSDSPVGTITYTESGWWQLTSLVPQR